MTGILSLPVIGMLALNVIADIKHYTCKKVKYKRETHSQKRCVDKEKADLRDRNVKTFAQVSTYPKGVALKKCKYPL
jgi:hypothetical protein